MNSSFARLSAVSDSLKSITKWFFFPDFIYISSGIIMLEKSFVRKICVRKKFYSKKIWFERIYVRNENIVRKKLCSQNNKKKFVKIFSEIQLCSKKTLFEKQIMTTSKQNFQFLRHKVWTLFKTLSDRLTTWQTFWVDYKSQKQNSR